MHDLDGVVGAGDAGADGDEDGVATGPPTVPLPQRRVAWLCGLFARATRRGVRCDPGRPGAVALVLVAAVAAVVAAVGVWTARPQAEPVRGLPAVAVDGAASRGGEAGADGAAGGAGAATGGDACGVPRGAGSVAGPVVAGAGGGAGEVPGGGTRGGARAAGSGAAGAAASPPVVLVVSVAGRVGQPGVVRVPDGARVVDVLAAAGGAQPGVDLSGLNLARRVVDGEQIAVGVPPAPDAAGHPPSGGSAGAGGRGPAQLRGRALPVARRRSTSTPRAWRSSTRSPASAR